MARNELSIWNARGESLRLLGDRLSRRAVGPEISPQSGGAPLLDGRLARGVYHVFIVDLRELEIAPGWRNAACRSESGGQHVVGTRRSLGWSYGRVIVIGYQHGA